jgi:hypothetical protein
MILLEVTLSRKTAIENASTRVSGSESILAERSISDSHCRYGRSGEISRHWAHLRSATSPTSAMLLAN